MSNHAFDVDDLDKDIEVVVIKGVEGVALGIDEYRVAGPKPWGGGTITQRWTVSRRDLLQGLFQIPDHALDYDGELKRLAGEDATAFHQERRRRQSSAFLDYLADAIGEELVELEPSDYGR